MGLEVTLIGPTPHHRRRHVKGVQQTNGHQGEEGDGVLCHGPIEFHSSEHQNDRAHPNPKGKDTDEAAKSVEHDRVFRTTPIDGIPPHEVQQEQDRVLLCHGNGRGVGHVCRHNWR